ncbi:hypothetical protein DFAR_3960028 [Desulfarculales bacterium]
MFLNELSFSMLILAYLSRDCQIFFQAAQKIAPKRVAAIKGFPSCLPRPRRRLKKYLPRNNAQTQVSSIVQRIAEGFRFGP